MCVCVRVSEGVREGCVHVTEDKRENAKINNKDDMYITEIVLYHTHRPADGFLSLLPECVCVCVYVLQLGHG